MKIAIAGDSAGIGLAKILADHLSGKFDVEEISIPNDGSGEFYANLSDRVGSAVINEEYQKAILVCGTGIGVCISANKVPGVRAAHCHDAYSAERAALSNNAQIITMGARVIGPELAKTIADAFLSKEFDVNGRSAQNVDAINDVDKSYRTSSQAHDDP
jgi:ribose 5-phosphate isomerase B